MFYLCRSLSLRQTTTAANECSMASLDRTLFPPQYDHSRQEQLRSAKATFYTVLRTNAAVVVSY